MNPIEKTKNQKRHWFKLCHKCGNELYPNADKKRWGAITVQLDGKCPRCGIRATLIPTSDWEYASSGNTSLFD